MKLLADTKGLPAEWLAREWGIKVKYPGPDKQPPLAGWEIPYKDMEGNPLPSRYRIQPGAQFRFYNLKETPPSPYGLHKLARAREANFLCLVEGESDTWTLDYKGVPVLGIPGSGTTRYLQGEHLQQIGCVYVLKDNDEGGDTFVTELVEQLHAIGFAGDAFCIRLPATFKDVNDLWRDNQEAFLDRFKECLEASVPLLLAGQPVAGNGPPEDPPTGPGQDRAAPPATVHLTDTGNAIRLVRCYGNRLRYCSLWKKWLLWDEQRWSVDKTGEANRRARDTVIDLWRDTVRESAELEGQLRALGDGGPEQAKTDLSKRLSIIHAIQKWCIKSESADKLGAMLKLATTTEGIPVLPDQMDKDSWLLNCPNGTVDLRSGRLLPHNQGHMITKLCPTPFNPRARCPLWEKTVRVILAEDDQLLTFLKRLLGRCLTGDVSEQILTILWGNGANGKSTIIKTLLAVIGEDYAGMTPPKFLMASIGERHPTERADLHGKRLIVASETTQDGHLNEEFVKDLTGGDRIKARRMREDFWEFDPTHKLFLLTNHKPLIKGTDDAIWRRVRLVPFTVWFWDPDDPKNAGKDLPPERRANKHLAEELLAEREGILAWLVAGCLDWQRRGGLTLPEKVRAATMEYREEEDVFRRFLAARCVLGSAEYKARPGPLYKEFCNWHVEEMGEDAPKQRALANYLSKVEGVKRDRVQCNLYTGIMLRPQEEQDWDED